MKSLLIYDSVYGNTEKIAQSIANVLTEQGETILVRVGDYKMDMLLGIEILVVGSPTQQFRATAAMKGFLKSIPPGSLKGIRVAAFDTRLTQANIDGTPVLPHFVKLFGYAAGPIGKVLEKKGGRLLIPAEGFYVKGMEGPLVEGELERAATWARKLFAPS